MPFVQLSSGTAHVDAEYLLGIHLLYVTVVNVTRPQKLAKMSSIPRKTYNFTTIFNLRTNACLP